MYLLGKGKRYLRIAAAHLLKSLYESNVVPFNQIVSICLEKFKTLGASGVNSSEFLSIFGYLCDKELRKGTIDHGIVQKIV